MKGIGYQIGEVKKVLKIKFGRIPMTLNLLRHFYQAMNLPIMYGGMT